MKITLSNQIEINTTPDNEQQVIEQFTFANPKYQDAISFGRSTRGIDRYLYLVEREENKPIPRLMAPMGILDYLLTTFKPEVIDQRVERAVKASNSMGTIILCSQVRHCELLGVLCTEAGAKPLVLHGQLPTKARVERMSKAQDAPLIIGTLSLLSEGIDLPHLSALIFAAPVSAVIDKDNPAATRLIQSIGRCRRPYQGKPKAYVLDIIDQCGFGVSAWNKRATIYQQQGFEVRL